MAIAFTRRVTHSDNVNATAFSSSSWTPASGEAHLALVVSRVASQNTPTLSGNGLTWVQIATQQLGNAVVRLTTFYAVGVASPSAGAITADFGGQTQESCHIHVDELTDADDTAPVNTGNKQLATASATSLATAALSAVAAGGAIWAGCAAQLNEAQSAVADYTGLGSTNVNATNSSALTIYDADGADLTAAFSSTTSDQRGIIAIEVVAAPTSITVTPTTAALTTATFAPTVTASDHKVVTPGMAGAYPPDTTLSYVATPAVTMPGYLETITDPTWGTRITRISDVIGAVHVQAKQRAFNNSETKMMLGQTAPRALLRTSDWAVLNAAVGGDGKWDFLNDDLLVRVTTATGAVFGYNPETNTNTGTIKDYSTYANASQFDFVTQMSPSDDGRYWLFKGQTGAGQKVVLLWDRTLDTTTVLNVTTMPHSGSMSHSGTYLNLNWDAAGTGNEQGIWLLDQTLTRIRQIEELKLHADFAWDSDGAEVFVAAPTNVSPDFDVDIYMYRCSDGLKTKVLTGPVAFRHGHYSGRNKDRPGWAYFSVYDTVTSSQAGTDQVVAVKLDGSETVQVFAHVHEDTGSNTANDAMATTNRAGTRVFFRSFWGGADVYEFMAEAVGGSGLSLTTFAPTVTASDHQSVTPTTASLISAMFAPTVTASDNQTVTPTTASLNLAAFVPDVLLTDNQLVTPEAASLALTTFAATVTAIAHQLVTPEAASLTLTGFAPTVLIPPRTLAVVGLTWDGFDVQRFDLDVFLEITEGLDELPELRSFHQVIPFRHGRRADAPYADKRPIVLTGFIAGPSATARSGYRGYVDEVKAAFTPLRDTPGTLVATLEDGTTRWIKAMPLDMRYRPIVPGAANTSIELIADDPFWYSAYGTLLMDDGIEMDDDYLMDSGGEIIVTPPTTEVTFVNPGTADVERVRVRFVGPSTTNVGVHNLSTPQPVGFTVGHVLAAGEEVNVNNYSRTVKLDGATNLRGDTTLMAGNRHGEYLRLIPGSNTLRILGAPGEAHISFFPTWL